MSEPVDQDKAGEDRLILEAILSAPNWKCGYCLARVGCDCDPSCEDYENRMGYPSPWSCWWM